MTARSSGPGPWPWIALIVITGVFAWLFTAALALPTVTSGAGDGFAKSAENQTGSFGTSLSDGTNSSDPALATIAAFLTAPSPTATATSTPLPKPIPTSTPIPVDQLYPACAPDTPGGSICRPEPPPETPTPYPLCADGSYPRLCVVPTSVMHGMTEVETE